jgi:hypothetical protein
MPSRSSSKRVSSHNQSSENNAKGFIDTNERSTGFTLCGRISEPPGTKRRRRKESSELAPVRVKSEAELREEAAWKRVEETGKPVVLDGRLLVPDGMHVREAMKYLPDGIREQATEDLDRKLTGALRILLNGAKQQIREDAEKRGKLAEYEALPEIGKRALAEMVVRQQMHMPEVPLEEIIDRLQKEAKKMPEPMEQTQPAKVHRVQKPKTENRQEPDPKTMAKADLGIQTVPQPVFEHQESLRISQVSQWNLEHHGLLLKRLDQVWANLTAEEQQTILGYLGKRMGEAEINIIDGVIKGSQWVKKMSEDTKAFHNYRE